MSEVVERPWMVIRQVKPEHRPARPAPVTRQVTPVKAPQSAGWMQRLFAKAEPTTFQKCLAVHMAGAAARSAMH